MRCVVYYFYMQIRNDNFFKIFLLFWDQVDFVLLVKEFFFDDVLWIELEVFDLLCYVYVLS